MNAPLDARHHIAMQDEIIERQRKQIEAQAITIHRLNVKVTSLRRRCSILQRMVDAARLSDRQRERLETAADRARRKAERLFGIPLE